VEMNWLYILLSVAGLALTAAATIGLRARRSVRALERERKRLADEVMEYRRALTTLETQLAEARQSAVTGTPPERAASVFVPAPALTADQRAGALAMLRGGADAGVVCGAMRLPHPETILLQKVQRLLHSSSAPN
jgi:hypothetical protein